MWSVAESKACQTPHRNVDKLKVFIVEAWSDLDEAYIRKAYPAFQALVEAVVKNMVGLIE
jgi:quinol monooxygenase YgiN